MASGQDEVNELQRRLAELTQRVFRLEQLAGVKIVPVTEQPAIKEVVPAKTAEPRPTAPPPPPPYKIVPPEIAAKVAEPDLESRIGSEWLNRVGIVALLTGVAYFLKLAFDNGWIGASGRVSMGMLAGIALVAWSSRLHSKGYKYFSYSLTAAGIGIMYLSLWAAFQVYHLLPGGVAFVAMILVTVATAMLALKQDTQILAAVAIAGGLSTPLLLSTGENRPLELFSYIAILDLFSIVLVVLRPWRRVLLGSFIGTTIWYFAWYADFYSNDQRSIAVTFATIFFLIFAGLPVFKRLHFDEKSAGWAASKTFVFVALFTPFAYFVELFAIYESHDRTTLAWIAIGLAAFYIVISRQLAAEQPAERGQQGIGSLNQWLHLAIAITFLTIAIPLKMHGHWITMGWFVESAALLWVGNRAQNNFLKNAAIAALALGVVRLLFVDEFYATRLIFNSRFATYLLAIAVLSGIALQLRKERGPADSMLALATVCINVLALLALGAEISGYYSRQYQELQSSSGYYTPGDKWHDLRIARDFTYSALGMLYGAALMAVGFWRKLPMLRWQALVLMAATIAKVFIYDLSNLSGALRVVSFIALGVLLMGISFVYQKDWLKLSAKESE
jgi:uncharacterized membrane protein